VALKTSSFNAYKGFFTFLLAVPWLCPLALDVYLIGVYNTHMNSAEIIKRLKQDGWFLHNVRGSHHQYKHPQKKGRVTVPHPKKDLPIGTYKNICKQAGWE